MALMSQMYHQNLFKSLCDDDNHIMKPYLLSVCYLYGYGVEANYELAFKEIENTNNDYSLLGFMYREGLGTEKNLDKALLNFENVMNLMIKEEIIITLYVV